jgi:archaellum component FlaG (FlaF/FlaG flagellin family)
LWSVNSAGQVYYGVQTSTIGTITWTQVTATPSFSNISVGVNGDVWALGPGIFYRTGITPSNPMGTSWQIINGGLANISVCPNGDIWGVNAGGDVWFTPKPPATNPTLTNWQQIPVSTQALQISVGANGSVWVIDRTEKIYNRTGISPTTPTGSTWQLYPGQFSNVAVCPNGDVWAIGAGNQAYYGKAPTVAGQITWLNPSSPIGFKQISVSPNGDVWVLAIDGTIYNRTGITATNPQGTTWQLYNGSYTWLTSGYKATEAFTIDNINKQLTYKNIILTLLILLVIYGIYHCYKL